jgi:SAP domain-containing ribonucleoprotein
MPEYSKMKNADLEALLKERGLPHTGKKADMVDRLQKDDEEKAAAPAGSKPPVSAEDEIDWDDEADEAAAAPAAATTTQEEPITTNEETVANAGGEGQPPNPQAVPNQVADIDPSKTDDLSVQPPAEGETGAEPAVEEKKEPAPDYSIGLAATNLDEEIEKRRKRALKFGMKPEEDEGLKKLERAKKFGEAGPPKGLDEALPERQRKRGREEGDDAGGNKRRGGARSGGRGGRGGRDRRDNRDRDGRDSRDNRRGESRSNGGGGGSSGWMSEKDRAAAEARKAKWSKPAA